MRDYILRRLLLIIPMMILASLLVFFSFRLIPVGPEVLRCPLGCPPEVQDALRERYGLDRPWYEQYWDWLSGVFTGDLGRSMAEGETRVVDQLERRMPITLELMFLATVVAVGIGVPAGIISAIRPGTVLDLFTRITGVVFLSVPEFYLATIVITFSFLWFGWSPPQFGTGYVPFADDPVANLQQFIVPALLLGVGSAAVLMRLVRSSVLEILRQDYIRTAWAKGLRERSVVTTHVMKNALIPAVTLIGLQLGALLGGAVIIENIFALPGVGPYLLESVIRRDVFVVQSLTLVFVIGYLLINLAVDVTYAWLDPRIRLA